MKKILFFCFTFLTLIGCDGMNNNYKSLMLLYGVQAIADSNIVPDSQTFHYKKYSGSGPVICFMGDSRIDLYPMQNYFDGKNIINYAKSGSTTWGLLCRINTVLLWNPDIIIISIGVNNIHNYRRNEIVSDIIYACKKFRENNPNVKIYVTNIVPFSSYKPLAGTYNALIAHYNDLLKTACADNDIGINFLYLDCMEIDGSLNQAFTTDGVHYNDAGYDALTVFLKSRIPELN